MTFHVGQKVVCVSSWPRPNGKWGYGDEIGPVRGQVYTVRAIGILHPAWPGDVCVLLNEIQNETRRYSMGLYEPSFGVERFRPLTDHKSEVSFTMGADPDSEKWDNRKRVKVRS